MALRGADGIGSNRSNLVGAQHGAFAQRVSRLPVDEDNRDLPLAVD